MKENQIKWIWLPEWTAEDKEKPILALFLKKADLKTEPEKAFIKISADTRYKLYINGQLVEIGPSRGDCQIWYYDEWSLIIRSMTSAMPRCIRSICAWRRSRRMSFSGEGSDSTSTMTWTK